MTIRNNQAIQEIVDRSKANMFLKEQTYGERLTLGVASPPKLFLQSNLIFAASSPYATLAQRNAFVELLSKNKMDVLSPQGYAVRSYFVQGYAQ